MVFPVQFRGNLANNLGFITAGERAHHGDGARFLQDGGNSLQSDGTGVGTQKTRV